MHVGNGEILDDVWRHGSHDGTWCFDHERNVSGYLSISTNNRSNELSYSKFHSRILFTRMWKHIVLERDGITSYMRDMVFIHKCLMLPEGYTLGNGDTCCDIHAKCIFHTTSKKKAYDLWNTCLRLHPCACQRMIQAKGVLMGQKNPKSSLLDVVEREGLRDFWIKRYAHTFSIDQIHSNAFFYTKVFVNGIKYTLGEFVVLQCSSWHDREETTYRGCLRKIFAHQQRGEINIFVVVEYMLDNLHELDNISGMFLASKFQKTYCGLIVRPIDCLQHKFFWLPTCSNDKEVIYETSGFKVRSRLLHPGNVGCVPPWIEEGDRVLAKVSDTSNNTALVRGVDINNKRARLEWENGPLGEHWTDWKHVYKVL